MSGAPYTQGHSQYDILQPPGSQPVMPPTQMRYPPGQSAPHPSYMPTPQMYPTAAPQAGFENPSTYDYIHPISSQGPYGSSSSAYHQVASSQFPATNLAPFTPDVSSAQ
jgi:hypothetical protein